MNNTTTNFDDIRYKETIQAIEHIEKYGYQAFLAGGCVRDRIMGIIPKDYDIATNAPIEVICSIFKQNNLRILPIGLKHGTVSLLMPNGQIEITTLRKDIKTNGRYAQVSFENVDLKEDASRRDFTINAMFEDKEGRIIDFFNGIQDIKNKILRFVGDPQQRITEDYLRILRLFRFWAKFGFIPESKAINAITQLKSGLKQISQERITNELSQMFSHEYMIEPLVTMVNTSVFKTILEDLVIKDDKIYDAIYKCKFIKEEYRFIARLGVLTYYNNMDEKQIINLALKLKLSNIDKQRLIILTTFHHKIKNMQYERYSAMDFIDECERLTLPYEFHNLFSQFWLIVLEDPNLIQRRNWICEIEQKYGYLRHTPMPINGSDLKKFLGLKEGKKIGLILKQLLKDFRNSKWQTKEEGLNLAKQYL